jgi:hypothetical protein
VENRKRLRPPEAAEYLGTSTSTLAKWRMAGNGPPYSKLGGGRIISYDVGDLERYAEGRRRRSTSEPAPAGEQNARAGRPRPGVINGGASTLDLTLPVKELEFSTRVTNALLADGIDALHELLGKTEAELLGIPNLGKVSLAEIKSTLRKRRLRLGMEIAPGLEAGEKNFDEESRAARRRTRR